MPRFLLDLGLDPWFVWALAFICGAAVAVVGLFVARIAFGPSNNRRGARPAAGDDPWQPFRGVAALEKRNNSRRQGNPVQVFVTDAKALTEPIRGWVLDRSVGGLCLSVPERVDEGITVSVRPCQAPAATPWIRLLVRSSRQDGPVWELGCQFTEPPSRNQLLLFG